MATIKRGIAERAAENPDFDLSQVAHGTPEKIDEIEQAAAGNLEHDRFSAPRNPSIPSIDDLLKA